MKSERVPPPRYSGGTTRSNLITTGDNGCLDVLLCSVGSGNESWQGWGHGHGPTKVHACRPRIIIYILLYYVWCGQSSPIQYTMSACPLRGRSAAPSRHMSSFPAFSFIGPGPAFPHLHSFRHMSRMSPSLFSRFLYYSMRQIASGMSIKTSYICIAGDHPYSIFQDKSNCRDSTSLNTSVTECGVSTNMIDILKRRLCGIQARTIRFFLISATTPIAFHRTIEAIHFSYQFFLSAVTRGDYLPHANSKASMHCMVIEGWIF